MPFVEIKPDAAAVIGIDLASGPDETAIAIVEEGKIVEVKSGSFVCAFKTVTAGEFQPPCPICGKYPPPCPYDVSQRKSAAAPPRDWRAGRTKSGDMM